MQAPNGCHSLCSESKSEKLEIIIIHLVILGTKIFAGPSMSIDTACSSTLLGLQMACQSIRNGDCDAALVGGTNLVLKPQSSLQLLRMKMLSPDGVCKSFDARGNG